MQDEGAFLIRTFGNAIKNIIRLKAWQKMGRSVTRTISAFPMCHIFKYF
jgi:hypothetical protein